MAELVALGSPERYTIAWLAALNIERSAAHAMLDEEHAEPTGFKRHQSDKNVYTWGRIGEHNIVIVSIAAGCYGPIWAAATASNLVASLPSIRVGLFVGIGGGVGQPSKEVDIRLGDVAVSQPDRTSGGVCQYDLVKVQAGKKYELKGFLAPPSLVLLNALKAIQARHEMHDSKVPAYLREMVAKYPKMGKSTKLKPSYCHQGAENDRLFKSKYVHVSVIDCKGCDVTQTIEREEREDLDPVVHYGNIASGGELIKDAEERDRVLEMLDQNCICFEMEASGLMNYFPCLVIRGISDYADSHKNDRWQRYAAATAAAYTKEFLGYVPMFKVQQMETAANLLHNNYKPDTLQQTVTATKETTEGIVSDLDVENIKEWLNPSDTSTNANNARELRHEGTGMWLLEHPLFREWCQGKRRHVWLNAVAGSGKTCLATAVLDHLKAERDTLIFSFFFDFGDVKKRTLDDMLRSLVFQIYQSCPNSKPALAALRKAHRDGGEQPTTRALESTIFEMLENEKKCFIVLDALDELTVRDDIFFWIKDVWSEAENIQLLTTSRPEREFIGAMPAIIGHDSCLLLDKRAINADIKSYVAAQLVRNRDFQRMELSSKIIDKVLAEFGNKADGMFQWAFCQLESLARCPHEAAIESALATLPRTLDSTYNHMIQSIPPERKSDAIRLLQFITHTDRPLSVSEAKEIIATQIDCIPRRFDVKRRLFDDAEILSYCPGLILIVQSDPRTLQLTHFSVQEYLSSLEEFSLETSSVPITLTFLTYLKAINTYDRLCSDSMPLSTYSAQEWVVFASKASESEDVKHEVIEFLHAESLFKAWQKSPIKPIERRWDPQRFMASFGYKLPGLDIIAKGARVNASSSEYGNALQAASAAGQLKTVQLLLRSRATDSIPSGFLFNALQAASSNGHLDIVELVLKSDVLIQTYNSSRLTDVLHTAAKKDQLQIVLLLLKSGADVDAESLRYSNALHAAAEGGCLEIIQLILTWEADVSTSKLSNALQAASRGGYIDIVKLFLALGADVNAQSDRYGTALQAAALGGHRRMVNILLSAGADIGTKGGGYDSAYRIAMDVADDYDMAEDILAHALTSQK